MLFIIHCTLILGTKKMMARNGVPKTFIGDLTITCAGNASVDHSLQTNRILSLLEKKAALFGGLL